MNIALDENGNRILPFKSGRGFCQVCGELLIAHCGEIYKDHWKHYHEANCDSWKEHETEWHRNWKNEFPVDWQEISIIKNQIKHIADIFTSNNLVIEFQNSPISPIVIREREEFYNKMIWVINAINFDKNLTIRSKVTSTIRQIEFDLKSNLNDLEENFNDNIEGLANDLREKEQEIQQSKDKIEKLKERNLEIVRIKEDLELYATKLLSSFSNSYYNIHFLSYQVWFKFYSPFKTAFSSFKDEKKKLNENKEALKEKIKRINNLESYTIRQIEHKKIPYNRINLENFREINLISINEIHSLFPNILKFRGENDYLTYKYKQANYIFLYNFSNDVTQYNLEINKIELEIKEIEVTILKKEEEIKNLLAIELTSEIIENKKEIEKEIDNFRNLENEYFNIEEKYERKNEENSIEYNNRKSEITQKSSYSKTRAMQILKGKYSFDWKHERKSWQAAKKTVFFDTGKGGLFQLISKNEVEKITIEEFKIRIKNI